MENLTATSERIVALHEEESLRPIPQELLVGALEYLDKVRGTSHMIDHKDVKSIIYKQMGWS